MTQSRQYAGIDIFRLIAAFLVIAIHTSPLIGFSSTGDFILTRITARIAVPFFFMTTGFFLISQHTRNTQKLSSFIRKTAVIYMAAIAVYLPINLYNGYFKADNLSAKLLKDIVFDGTFYHLWYLPASMLGASLAWYLVTKKGYKTALTAGTILYVIGLLGDSYYGIIAELPAFHGFYEFVFQFTDYTRNGLFFAPIFFVLGGFLADFRPKLSAEKSITGFAVSFLLMLTEGLLLHHYDLQRHDSMYVFLPICMFFLFCAILHVQGKRIKVLGQLSLWIYLMHPMMIIVVRFAAKVLHLRPLLVENSLVHFFAVSLLSFVFAAGMVYFEKKIKPQKEHCDEITDRAYVEINVPNLVHNAKELKRLMPPQCELMAVVKADAYGHGACEIAAELNCIGVNAFAAATIDEAIALRKCGVKGEILILGCTAAERAGQLHRYDLTQTLIDYDYALRLEQQNKAVKVHIKIDTGMHRLGFDWNDPEKICKVFAMKKLDVQGIFTHLCASDSIAQEDIAFTHKQIERFHGLLHELKERGIKIPKTHIQSSYGLLNYPEIRCNYVRAGIALYGVLSAPNDQTKLHPDLRPVLSLKTRVILIRKIAKGESVGYDRAFTAERDSVIAILPIGYADGFPRNLSNEKAHVLINGQKAPIIGKICMDQMAVDVTDVPDVKTGMTATLIGTQKDSKIEAADIAQNAESITNELLSRMGSRLKTLVIR